MPINPYLIAVIGILLGSCFLRLIIEVLNVNHLRTELPEGFERVYDPERYRRSQEYLIDNTRFDVMESSVTTSFLVIFILAGGFNFVDMTARRLGFGEILTGLAFAAMLVIVAVIWRLPFAWHRTFGIEGRYGFNRMDGRTFRIDIVKRLFLMAVIGGPVLALVICFFAGAGSWAWVYCWAAAAAIHLFLVFVAPTILMPLFNRFEPLADGKLKESITRYADEQGFAVGGILTMDGYRRSTKTNAFFVGFGRTRRIVLYDTLVDKHDPEELVIILAHEMGHFKKKHVHKLIGFAILSMGLMFYILSLFINNADLFSAFRMTHTSVYASLVFFGFIYGPIAAVLAIATNVVARGFEFEADAFASATYGNPELLIRALKKLSVDNLTNLTPHPLKVFFEYSHPPVLERIRRLAREP